MNGFAIHSSALAISQELFVVFVIVVSDKSIALRILRPPKQYFLDDSTC